MTTLSPYNEILWRHHQHPVHSGLPVEASINLREHNRVCGDQVHIGLHEEQGRIVTIGHESDGCLLCKASVSILCQTLHGVPVEAICSLYHWVAQITDFKQPMPDLAEARKWLGDRDARHDDLLALAEVRKFPTRRKCVMMSWDAVRQQYGCA